ncbi:MAG: hypothetical protein AVO39_10350 [delta proteobacterium MLS_D]|jgi:hypothetical protein|nr:MAG: hypothetical protein AVO39_10350 [delta proteobacterium MLS_D]
MSFMTPGVVAAMTAASTAVTAYSAIQQGQAQKDMAEYNAAVARANADAAVEAAAHEELQTREEARRLRGRMMALYGKSGITMEGSPLEVMADAAAEEELDVWAIRKTGSTKAARARSEAELSLMEGKARETSGYLQAGSSLLSGAADYGRATNRPRQK